MPQVSRPTVLLFCALLGGFPLATAGSTSWDPSFEKIAPWVIDHTASNQEAEFLVVMKEQADLAPTERLTNPVAKRNYVRDALFTKARESQAPLLAWLDERRIEHRSFYIVNAVLVRGSRAVAQSIAARLDVARLDGNPPITNLAPDPMTPAEPEAPERTTAPAVVEHNIANVRAPEVWAAGFTGQGIVIGSANTGVQWDHPALINHYRGWNGSSAQHDYNWHDAIHSSSGVCGSNSPVPCDDHNLGTHTTGTAVGSDASNTNQIGVAPGAKFIACRNMDQGTGTPATYLECMEWFLAPYPVGGSPAQGNPDLAPDITINSWQCPPSEGCQPATLQQAVEAQRAAGIMFVAAAGNAGPSCSTVNQPPSIYDAAYSVGAYNASTGVIGGFSSRGPVFIDGSNRIKPDLTAPGVNVRSSIRGSAYGLLTGTSMSPPHVAGAVALLWSAYPHIRNLIPETEDILNQSAVHVSTGDCRVCSMRPCSGVVPNNVYGWGRLDIKAAFDRGPVAVEPREEPASRSGSWLASTYPNPAHGATWLRFHLEREGEVRLAIYSTGGQRIRTFDREWRSAGEHALRWDGRRHDGKRVPAGIYMVRLESNGEVASRKFVWLGR